MTASFNAARLLGGVTLLALFGCQTYSPYGYGSGYGNPPPGAYTMPPGYVPRTGPTIVPGTTVQPRDGNLGQPGNLNPNGGMNAPKPGNGGSASNSKTPTFEANRGGGTGFLPNEKPVPVPKSPQSNDSFDNFKDTPAGGGSTPMGTAPKKENAATSGAGAPGGFPSGQSPFGSGAAVTPSGSTKIKLTGSEDGDRDSKEPARFQQPKTVSPVAPNPGGSKIETPPSAGTPMGNAAPSPNPYDYDQEKYAWLRGKVDYDVKTKSWQIIYSLNPRDKYGGSLILSDDPKLKKLQNDDVILVEGKLDATRKDGRGMPIYSITNLFGPLVPKTKLSNTTTSGVPNTNLATSGR